MAVDCTPDFTPIVTTTTGEDRTRQLVGDSTTGLTTTGGDSTTGLMATGGDSTTGLMATGGDSTTTEPYMTFHSQLCLINHTNSFITPFTLPCLCN